MCRESSARSCGREGSSGGRGEGDEIAVGIADLRQRRIVALIVVAECDPQPVEPAALGGEIGDIQEDRAAGGDVFAAGQHQPTFIGQLPVQQRGHRPVIRPAAEQLGVPAFGRGEIAVSNEGYVFWRFMALLQGG